MAKKSKVEKPEVAPEVVKVPCPDCNVLIADGGKSEFKFPKAGLINADNLCPMCAGSGQIEAKEE